MPSKKKQKREPKRESKREIKSYAHDKEERKNNPPVGLVTPQTDPTTIENKTYSYDPYLDPQLQWAGKAERTSFEVPTVSLHVHERIDPRTIIEAVRKRNGSDKQTCLFDNEANIPIRQAIEFYKHAQNWTNRLITGDSLLVMNSLLQKENMAGKVQCVYMDPPYGIKYSSNFQPYTNKREVKEGKDLTTEPEMIKAFRDTWELGVHSYLSYMRDRLLLAKELLSDSGSCFVQISDENIHHIREIMDEIFGAENFVSLITFRKNVLLFQTTLLGGNYDYLLWYSKNKEKIKYRKLFLPKTLGIDSSFKHIELSDGVKRKMTKEEKADPSLIPDDAKPFMLQNLLSSGYTESCYYDFEFDGRMIKRGKYSWKTTKQGMDKLVQKNRVWGSASRPGYVQYLSDYPVSPIDCSWNDTGPAQNQKYVVETNNKVIQRCILMTTDPGDLVLDPTCGSGTTAYVAEQWGRRWITCDTSRIATTLAKQRLMTAIFDYYKLAYPNEGVSSAFEYEKVPHITLKSVANNEPSATETLYDKPLKDTKKARVTGPFTVEAVPSPTVQAIDDIPEPPPSPADESVARSGATLRHDEWCDELLKTGIIVEGGRRISFSRINSWPGRWIHADAETKPNDSGDDEIEDAAPTYQPTRAVISFGPEHGLLESRQVEEALQEATRLKPTPPIVIFVAFQFDPEADKNINETNWPGVTILRTAMNSDLQTEDLKKRDPKSDSFWLIGQPEVSVNQIQEGDMMGQWQVEVHGFDYFNSKTRIESGDKSRIAVWMLDTDYDRRSLYPKQVFFPMADSKDGWAKLAKSLRAEIDETLIEAYKGTISLPFELGENKRIAVKIVDNRGIESLKVIDLTPEKNK